MGMVFGDISAVILSCWFLYSVWAPGFCTSTRKDYTPSSFRFLCIVASLFASFSPTLSQGVALLNTGEGRVNDAQWIRLRFLLRAQLALAIYTLLPVRIMTSTLVAVYFASCSIAKCGHPRMTFFSAASFSALHSSFRYLRSLYIIS